ncbi:hypothetical protein AB6D15_02190 [Vibrio splendidus]
MSLAPSTSNNREALIVALSERSYFGVSAVQKELKIGYLQAQRVIAELLLKKIAYKCPLSGSFRVVIPSENK